MGVPVAIQVYADDELLAIQAADAAYARFRELDRVMSDYDPDSELMRLCAASPTEHPVPVSADLFRVLERSQSLSERSEGAFDVTVGPIVNLWRVARRRQALPPSDAVQAALSKVGYQNVRLDPETSTAELLEPDMRIDLGGIAVGDAVDEAMRTFRERGVTRVLIDAAGDIAVGDPPPGRESWRVEIEPLGAEPDRRLVLELKNCAVTTSGDASKFVEFDGVRYSHIVDPQTGYGLTRRTSATVIAPDCITADSVATTLNVLGPERALELVATMPGVETSIETLDEADQFTTTQSPGFAEFLAPAD
ncbi:MAG: FAD:protein FMN transferase [Planctomycetaceae bacterium]|nr:FAD:protein FMN transferase [Planctomycetaceae bacterium]